MPVTTASGRPNVAMIVSGDVFGGAERQLITLCTAARDLFDVTVATTLPGPVARITTDAGLSCVDLSLAGRGVAKCARRLRALAAERKIDLFHTHGYRSAVIAALGRPRGTPVVRTIHGATESNGATKVALYELIGRFADRWTSARCVYVSAELSGRLGRSGRCSVIYNGIGAAPPIGRRPTEFPPDRFNLVAVGRLEPVKGLENAIAAMSDETLRKRAVLHIVGDGPLRQALGDQVVRDELQDVVRFWGFRADAPNLIAHAGALLMSSLHEGIPYVALEALASGTPVVATRVGGMPELIRDGVEGLLVPARSSTDLASAVNRLVADPALRASLSAAGRSRVATTFSATTMANSYAALYREALQKR